MQKHDLICTHVPSTQAATSLFSMSFTRLQGKFMSALCRSRDLPDRRMDRVLRSS